MTSLLEIAAQSKKVHGITVKGVSAKGISILLNEYPEVVSMMFKKTEMSAETLLNLAPDAVASIIAAGTGSPGDAEVIEAAAGLPIEWQLDLIDAIGKATMPNGVLPFLERLKAMQDVLVAAVPADLSEAQPDEPQVTTSPKASKA